MHLPGMKAMISLLITKSTEDESKSEGIVNIKHEMTLIEKKQ